MAIILLVIELAVRTEISGEKSSLPKPILIRLFPRQESDQASRQRIALPSAPFQTTSDIADDCLFSIGYVVIWPLLYDGNSTECLRKP